MEEEFCDNYSSSAFLHTWPPSQAFIGGSVVIASMAVVGAVVLSRYGVELQSKGVVLGTIAAITVALSSYYTYNYVCIPYVLNEIDRFLVRPGQAHPFLFVFVSLSGISCAYLVKYGKERYFEEEANDLNLR